MLIVGTGGIAKDLITFWEILPEYKDTDLCFFNNIDTRNNLMLNKYLVHHTDEDVLHYFKSVSKEFLVCVGNPLKRYRLTNYFEKLGGELSSFVCGIGQTISPEMALGKGIIIQPTTVISKNVIIEKGVFINAGTIIGHDVIIKEFVSLGPGVRVLGGVEVGEFSYIGTNSVIMPGVKIGKKVRIGVNLVIDKDVPDNSKIV